MPRSIRSTLYTAVAKRCMHCSGSFFPMKMSPLFVIAALFTAGHAIISQPHGCSSSDKVCAPRVITYCPRKDPISECSTCCCDSSENVEFYNPDQPEPWCSAPPAVYTVTFVGTWTGVCQPDYYPLTAHWSPPTGASHTTDYQMWDACMDDVSPGVAQVSQFGATTLIEGEYEDNSEHILDTFKANLIAGAGITSGELYVDKYHQWVSTVSMLAPSLDRMVGVADLRLCDGNDWKKSVKVCSELFSTATRSQRVHPSMQRNSVQWNNCSFGYFRFTFKEYQNASQERPTDCQQQSSDVCPPSEERPSNCRTCCCKTSDNAHFYHLDSIPEHQCTATEPADYKVSLIPSISNVCHNTYPFFGGGGAKNSYFSDLLLATHGPVNNFDSCGEQMSSDMREYIVSTEHLLPVIRRNLELQVDSGILGSYYVGSKVLERGQPKRRSGRIDVFPWAPYLTLISKLLPSGPDDQWVGFSGLDLCGPEGWKESVQVCLPLLAIANRTADPNARTQLQENHCSFARALIERRIPPVSPPAPANCTPLDKRVYLDPDFDNSSCCNLEFIIEGQILRVSERYEDLEYRYNLLVGVSAVHYDEIDHIKVGDVITIKTCSLPSRIRFKRTYHLSGSRECETNELEISQNGVIADIPTLGAGPCPPYILAGNCDDPR